MNPFPLKTDIPFLSVQECSSLVSTLCELRKEWYMPSQNWPWYVLGTPSYVFARDSASNYFERARRLNQLMYARMSVIYDKFLDTVEREISEPFKYASGLSLPGFHIYEHGHGVQVKEFAAHFDTQYELHDWSQYGLVDPSQTLSLTAAISLPQCGAGLTVWDIDKSQVDEMNTDHFNDFLNIHSALYLPYSIGRLAIHSGLIYHKISTMTGIKPGETRITLQAHAVKTESGWLLYW